MIEGLSIGWMIARIFVHVIAGIGMFFGIHRILTIGVRNRWVKQSWEYVLAQTRQVQQRRELAYQRQYEEVGIQEKIPWIQRWDQMYAQSTIQQKYPVINAQLYASLLLVAASVAGLTVLLILYRRPGIGIGAGVIVFVAVLLMGMFYVNLLRRKRWTQTEKELMPFLNIVDNFSKTEQDLFRIFEMAAPYLQEPVKTALTACANHAMSTGNHREAIRDLLYGIEHTKFRELIQNLEICSKNDANYGKLLGDMRDSLSDYLSSKKEEAGISREGQVQMIVVACLGILMLIILSIITQVPLSDLAGDFLGRCIIVYWIILGLVIIYQMFFAVAGRES